MPTPLTQPQLLPLANIMDARGHLGVLEASSQLPFAVQRLFFIYNTPAHSHRGGHAHKALHQFLVFFGPNALSVSVHNGKQAQHFAVPPYSEGLYLPPGHWVDIEEIPLGSHILVLCSAPYEEADYIRDFAAFLSYHQAQASA